MSSAQSDRDRLHLRMRQDFAVQFGFAVGLALGAWAGTGMDATVVALSGLGVFLLGTFSYCTRYWRLITKPEDNE